MIILSVRLQHIVVLMKCTFVMQKRTNSSPDLSLMFVDPSCSYFKELKLFLISILRKNKRMLQNSQHKRQGNLQVKRVGRQAPYLTQKQKEHGVGTRIFTG